MAQSDNIKSAPAWVWYLCRSMYLVSHILPSVGFNTEYIKILLQSTS